MRSYLLLFLPVLAMLPAARAQTTVDRIAVRIVNGRSGKPVKGVRAVLDVYPKAKYETPVDFSTDRQGQFSLLVQHACEISTSVPGYLACERRSGTDRKLPPTAFPVAQILSAGLLSPDSCGRPKQAPQPGSLILYVRPKSWWRRLL